MYDVFILEKPSLKIAKVHPFLFIYLFLALGPTTARILIPICPSSQNMENFSTLGERGSQTSTRSAGRSSERQIDSPALTKASLPCPCTWRFTHQMVTADCIFIACVQTSSFSFKHWCAFVCAGQCWTSPWWTCRASPSCPSATSPKTSSTKSGTWSCSMCATKTASSWPSCRPPVTSPTPTPFSWPKTSTLKVRRWCVCRCNCDFFFNCEHW